MVQPLQTVRLGDRDAATAASSGTFYWTMSGDPIIGDRGLYFFDRESMTITLLILSLQVLKNEKKQPLPWWPGLLAAAVYPTDRPTTTAQAQRCAACLIVCPPPGCCRTAVLFQLVLIASFAFYELVYQARPKLSPRNGNQ